ncbi:DNA endonuclease SmrA [Motiliproteus sediminis]|uniref:DNA endonuclease SmrA n=1 Tax=Motiliproteus sediminis TaxID=1468178 RepID=UPI001AEFF5EE|nr:DNA endonuclease SmrA [Motiliproteus sediminis]
MTSDQQLFQQAMAGVQPIRRSAREAVDKPVAKPTLAQLARRKAALHGAGELCLELSDYYPAHDPLDWARDGVQQGVLKKLRLGQYSIDARLEIVGLHEAAALDELLRFVEESRRLEVRTALINHGRGPSDRSAGNRLRSFLALWLPQLKGVQAFHSAQPQHGGLAATYLLLAKSERARESNRERQQRRRG